MQQFATNVLSLVSNLERDPKDFHGQSSEDSISKSVDSRVRVNLFISVFIRGNPFIEENILTHLTSYYMYLHLTQSLKSSVANFMTQ